MPAQYCHAFVALKLNPEDYVLSKRSWVVTMRIKTLQCILLVLPLVACGPAAPRAGAQAQPKMGMLGMSDPSLAVQDFFARQGWPVEFAEIGGYHDEQKLASGNGANATFGPKVAVYAVPNLGAFTNEADFDTPDGHGQVVAVAEVPPAASYPQAYQDLGLSGPGLYCVSLAATKTGSNTSWTGFVTHVTPTGDCDRYFATAPSGGGTSPGLSVATPVSGSINPADVPPVVRFTTDAAGHPSIGVKCPAGWCDIGGNGKYQAPLHTGVSGNPTSREWMVKGWHDEQRYADPNAKPVKPGPAAIVTPEASIDTITRATFRKGPVKVAYIYLDQGTYTDPVPPKGSLAETWGLAVGTNYVTLTEAASGEWQAQFFAPGPTGNYVTNGKVFHVDREQHTIHVPGVARWIWSDADDALWVTCDVGCCSVTGTQVM